MNRFAAPEQVARWTSDYCNGELEPAAATELSSLLRQDVGLRGWFLDYMQVHAQLQWEHRASRATHANPASAGFGKPGVPAQPAAAEVPPAPAEPAPPGRSTTQILNLSDGVLNTLGAWLSNSKLLILTVVGGFCLYFIGLMVSIAIERERQKGEPPSRNLAAQHSPARIIADAGCRWTRRSSAANGDLPPGPDRSLLVDGVVELEFFDGARVRIEGPAEFAACSGGRLDLARGRLLAYVPRQARGFTVTTPTAEVVDLGTEFGLEVDGQGGTDLHVIRGRVEVTPAAGSAGRRAAGQRIVAGQAVRVSTPGQVTSPIPFDGARFEDARSAIAAPTPSPARGTQPVLSEQSIWLGNLFDDGPRTPLAEAMRSDSLNATPAFNTLGVFSVFYGDVALKEIAPGLKFDLASLGWTADTAQHHVANDAYTDDVTFSSGQRSGGGIRLSGKPLGLHEPKMEEGIGMHANALVTFDLDEIRRAGQLGRCGFEFVCDRAGINDTAAEHKSGSVHMAVLVSRRDAPESAWVDGAVATLDKHDGNWFVASPIGEPLRADGRYVSFRVPVDSATQLLTLVATCAGDDVSFDHAVWLGARLEVIGAKNTDQKVLAPR